MPAATSGSACNEAGNRSLIAWHDMKPGALSLSDLLRARAPHEAPVDLLLDSWAQVEDAVLADGQAAREAFTAASDALPSLAGALSDRRALAVAVVDTRGRRYFADPAYAALFRDDGDLQPLLKRALRDGSLVSLVEGAAGVAFTAWIGDEAAAARWPLEPEAAAALAAGRQRLAVIVNAPSRSSDLARHAARALDLTALEARLAEALLFAPNLNVAAADAGVGRETARDALRRINAKAGVRRMPELVARLIALMSASQDPVEGDIETAQTAFALTPAEARCAAHIARGLTAPEAAEALSVSPETVKSHMKSVMAKTGAKGAKDLARMLAEAHELVAVANGAEPMFAEVEGGGRLRVVPAFDGARRIALIDYGPYDGQPVLMFHGAAAGRRLPTAFREHLVARGLRPVVIQRPGFGLTDLSPGDHAQTGAADMAAVVERLKLDRVHMVARDTGIPVALAFAQRYPHRLIRAILLNPQAPISVGPGGDTLAGAVQRRLLHNPDMVAAFAEFLRRQATTALLERILLRVFSEAALDAAALRDPAVLSFLIRDVQAMCARSVRGFADEQALYAGGWEPPTGLSTDIDWSYVKPTGLGEGPDPAWLGIADLRVERLEGAGVLPQFTHAQALAEIIASPG